MILNGRRLVDVVDRHSNDGRVLEACGICDGNREGVLTDGLMVQRSDHRDVAAVVDGEVIAGDSKRKHIAGIRIVEGQETDLRPNEAVFVNVQGLVFNGGGLVPADGKDAHPVSAAGAVVVTIQAQSCQVVNACVARNRQAVPALGKRTSLDPQGHRVRANIKDRVQHKQRVIAIIEELVGT